MQFPSNLPLHFSRVEKNGSSKNKKDGKNRNRGVMGGNGEENFRSTRDLTLKDTGAFVLYEFSVSFQFTKGRNDFCPLLTALFQLFSCLPLSDLQEEYPPILSKQGMGSLMVNYYRKKDAKDETIPKSDLGEPFVLDVNDESPFMKFGFVNPGESIPTMYTNLIRAPLFKHKPKGTDYLLIR